MNKKWFAAVLLSGFAATTAFAAPAFGADMRAAKKEGKVTWYSSITLKIAQTVCNTYNKKKTGIKCNLHRSGSGKLYRRYLQEAKGGIFVADVIHTSNIGHFFKLKKKYLIPYKPKGTERFDPSFRTKHNYWTILRAGVFVAAYNTKYVKPEEVPKKWTDFLHPRWKNRLVSANPSYSGFTTTGVIAIVNMYGWDYYKKLAKQNVKIIPSAGATLAIVARGEAHATVGTTSYSLFNVIKRGEPIKIILPEEGVPYVTSPNSVLKKAPHPNAARVFTDWLFSLEAQQLLVDHGLHVGHPDVKYPQGWPTLKEFKRIIIPPEEKKRKTKKVRKTFRKLFGV